MSVRVVIVDDHDVIRVGVRESLDNGIEVVGDGRDVKSAIEAVSAHHPEVVILDVHLPGGTGGGALDVLDAFHAAGGEVAQADEEPDKLTEREQEVMRLIARGYTYREVAEKLFISIKTVETHVGKVLHNLHQTHVTNLTSLHRVICCTA